MTTQAPTNEQPTQATAPAEIGELSFTDYVMVRRGEKPPESKAQSAPTEEAQKEQNKSSEPDTEETEAKDAAESDDTEGDEPKDAKDTDEDKKPKAKKGGWQRRIDKEVGRRRELEREVEYLRKLALNGAPDSEKKDAPVESTKTTDGDEPQPEQFETQSAYLKALAKHMSDQTLKARDAEQRKSELQKEQEKLLTTFQAKVKDFAEKHEDYEDTLAAVDHIPISATVHESIVSVGPELAYELAKLGDEEFARINSLPPLAAARAIGRIEARLATQAPEAPKKPESKKITQAPKPLDPVGKGAATVRKSIHDQDIPFDEYVRLRREQERKKRGA